jgi:hypothetical protein
VGDVWEEVYGEAGLSRSLLCLFCCRCCSESLPSGCVHVEVEVFFGVLDGVVVLRGVLVGVSFCAFEGVFDRLVELVRVGGARVSDCVEERSLFSGRCQG